MDELHDLASTGFSRDVDAYERARPGYPPEALSFLAEVLGVEESWTILELAAGTGKLTRALLSWGTDLVAVEPLPEMREKVTEVLPQVDVREGWAEAIPLADGAADAVFVGQAFHWFDYPEALPEIHRVLRTKGHLVVLWNVRDRSADWVAGVAEVIAPYRERIPAYERWREPLAASPLFEPAGERTFPHQQELTPELLVDQVASTSAIAVLPERERRAVLAEIRQILATHPQTSGRERLLVPFRTEVAWAVAAGHDR